MAEDDEHTGRRAQYELGRVLALSDGVFAIAMTLLVLDVPVPHLAQAHPRDADLLGALSGAVPNLLGFGLSFWLVASIWVSHRQLLRDVIRIEPALLWLNVLLLLLVCLVPFTAGVLSRYGELATAAILYAANMAALSAVASGMRVACWRSGLLAPSPSAQQRRWTLAQSLASAAIFAASMPIALGSATVAELSWLALTWPLLLRLVRRALGRRPGESFADGRWR